MFRTGYRRISEVRAFAERLHASLVEPVHFDGVPLTFGAAIGVATTDRDGRDIEALIRKSDLAMYSAKTQAGTNICLFDADMDRQNRERILLIQDMRNAIRNGEFELVYQLQNDVESRDGNGFEALLRWNHPVHGLISPARFIPLAEQTGLIREIGLCVLRTACHEAASWDTPMRIAVNVAPQQLAQPSFTEHLSDILMESGIDPGRLELEITEASIIDDQKHALAVMHKIKAMGVKIAMDDFGTGFSSLAMLRTFPFDKIKIDRSFIQDVHEDEQRAAIVRSTLLLGEALRIPVLAEGVELETELAFLKTERCQLVQGFLFGRPKTLAEAREYVQQVRLRKAS
ncbi:putative bifunctional diguanylate cyclase/phosphodiesterase [Citreimonas sp.]|uniref:putative bifunctional diguanylate cyclase/phosphodiesterase n=1 Tax=Citreimonas sp. TaxID=3036715 RepID=UPI0040587DB6